MMMGGDGWSWIGGGLMMLFFWGGLVALVVFLARGFGTGASRREETGNAPNARDVLAERFARGEISVEEFEERKQVLERKAS